MKRNAARTRIIGIHIAAQVLLVAWFGYGSSGFARNGTEPAAATVAAHSATIPVESNRWLPLTEISAGMRGYGLTVFKGSRIDTFGVEVIGVQRNVRAAGSVILVEVSGHDLEFTAIPRGMSGSPVFLDGRLAGAVAFGWSGALRPIVGVTPAEEMLAMPTAAAAPMDLDSDSDSVKPVASGGQPELMAAATDLLPGQLNRLLDPGGRGRFLAARMFSSASTAAAGETTWRVGDQSRQDAAGATAQHGHDPRSGTETAWPDPMQLAEQLLLPVSPAAAGPGQEWQPLPATLIYAPLGRTESVQAPGGGAGAGNRFAPGSACAVPLVLGDALLGSIGTTTWVEDDRVYLLGHPLMQQGAVTFPLAAAEILSIFPSRQMSFKMGAIGEVVGSVFHDLRSGVTGRLGPGPDLLPVNVQLERSTGQEQYHFEVVQDPRLTPALVFWCLYNALLVRGDDLSLQTIGYHLDTVWRDSQGNEESVGIDGAVAGPGAMIALAAEWMAPLRILVANRHRPLRLIAVDGSLRISPCLEMATISSVTVPRSLERGADLPVTVTLHPRRGRSETVSHLLALPLHLPPGHYRLLVANGRDVFALESERAAGKFADLSYQATLDLLHSPRTATELALVLYAPSRGVLVDGHELADLPASVGKLLRQERSGRISPTLADIIARKRVETGQVLDGHVIRDIVIRQSSAPTRKEARP
ncbi:MAG: hypothetical protein ABIF77_16185 [bacterium]